MSFTTIDNDLFEQEMTIQEHSLLIALIRYYNTDKGYAYPSYAKLKKASRIVDNRTLINNVNSLIEKGYLKKETIKGVGTKYYILKFIPSGELHQVENYTTCKTTSTPSVELHNDPVENYTTTNTNTNTNKKEVGNFKTDIDKIISSYTDNGNLREVIRDFVKMRKAIKKVMTDKALKLTLNKLDKLTTDDNIKIEILNQSIVNSWQGVFPLRVEAHQETAATKERRMEDYI